MKKIFKRALIVVATLLLVVAGISLYVYLTVDKDWLEERLETSLLRKVTIEDIRFSPFSAVAGIQVAGVEVSDRMEAERIERISTVPPDELFVRMDSGRIRFRLFSLLSRSLDIREIVLDEPEIRVLRHPDGSFNFSDLIPAERSETNIIISRISISSGRTSLVDRISGNSYEISDFDLSGEKSGPDLNVRADFRIQAQRLKAPRFARDLNVEFEIEGTLAALLSPQATTLPPFRLDIHTPKGWIEGLLIFERIKQVPVLKDYFGTLDFLGENIEWEGGSLEVSQKEGTIRISEGEIKVEDYRFTYDGTLENSGAMDVRAVLILPGEMTETFRNILRTNMNELLSENLKKRISVDEIAGELVKPLIQENDQIRLTFRIGGTAADPRVSLEAPDLPDFGEALIRLAGKEARSSILSLVESLADRIGKDWLKKKK
jgi:hypothetical protein